MLLGEGELPSPRDEPLPAYPIQSGPPRKPYTHINSKIKLSRLYLHNCAHMYINHTHTRVTIIKKYQFEMGRTWKGLEGGDLGGAGGRKGEGAK